MNDTETGTRPRCALVFVTDARGLDLARHAIAVAMATQDQFDAVVLSCVDFEPPRDAALEALAARRGLVLERQRIDLVDMPIAACDGQGVHAHVTAATFAKIFALDRLAGAYERALYVDIDALLMHPFDIRNLDFEGHPIAAVFDFAIASGYDNGGEIFRRTAALGRSADYLNAGVIAIDYAAWQPDFVARFSAAAARHGAHCDYKTSCSNNDQCCWNMVFENAWKKLPLTLNYQGCAMFNAGWRNAVVRHYVGSAKFLPLRAWRNDRKDTAVLRRARIDLALPPVRQQLFASLVRTLNRLRNRARARRMQRAIASLDARLDRTPGNDPQSPFSTRQTRL